MTTETIILSHQDVTSLLSPDEVLPMVDAVFQEWGRDGVVMPPKVNLDMSRSGHDSWANAMPAYLPCSGAAGLKWVGGYGSNPPAGLPYIMGIVILTDPQTGRTLSLLDGTYISDWRTGASAAVAAKYLAGPGLERIALIGAGAQNRTAAACLQQVFPEASYTVADLSPERREAFCADLHEQHGLRIGPAATVQAAVDGAGVVVLLTTAHEPFLKAEWLAPGCLTLGMGSYQQAEDAVTLSADMLVVDCWGQAEHRGELKQLVESGQLSRDDVATELGAVAAGAHRGRAAAGDRIVCVLVGLGAHDVYIAGEVYKRALAAGAGQRVRL